MNYNKMVLEYINKYENDEPIFIEDVKENIINIISDDNIINKCNFK